MGHSRHSTECKHILACRLVAEWTKDGAYSATPDLCIVCRKLPTGPGSQLCNECAKELFEEWKGQQAADAANRDKPAGEA